MNEQDKPIEIPFIYRYINAYSPVGMEEEGQSIWRNYISKYVDDLQTDPYGTAVATIKSDSVIPTVDFNVVIEAHCDEIAWIVSHVDDNGFIRVKTHGGSDNMIAPSMPVIIHTHTGQKVNGVFGWPAIHTRDKRVETGPAVDELWVDCGFKDKEDALSAEVEPGCVVTFKSELTRNGDFWVGKSLDNKLGGYIIAEVARRIHEREIRLPFNLHIVNSVQEEVGLYGAKMIAKTLKADLALVHDVTHATDYPGASLAKDGDVKAGMGPSLEYTAQNHRKINSKLREVAKENKLPLQVSVGSYGNDTLAFFLENTPTAILATPLRYMHTTVEMAHVDDVENCIELYIKFLQEIDTDFIADVHNIKL